MTSKAQLRNPPLSNKSLSSYPNYYQPKENQLLPPSNNSQGSFLGRPSNKPPDTLEFRPPNNQDFQIINNMVKPISQPSSAKSDTLQRLEVETASSTSIPISFPYYYIESEVNSMRSNPYSNLSSGKKEPTTEPLKENSQSEPLYSNISRTVPMVSPKDISNSQTPIKPSSTDGFNQVPKRFSQFVRDQQVPHYHNSDDATTTNSSSLGSESDSPLRKKSHSTLGMAPKQPRNSSTSNPFMSPHSDMGLNRQISESMGSQATIFSTRLEGEKHKKKKSHVYKTNSNTSSLTRSKAIRFKQGGLLYRMKLRLKKWLNNLRRFKFHKTASSKRTGNSLKRLKSKSKTLKRKFRSNPNNPTIKKIMNISAPLNNPTLTGATRVGTLDDDLKYEAGAPAENVRLLDQAQIKNEPKLTHLDEYIGQQQGLYLKDIDGKANSINYGRDKSASEIQKSHNNQKSHKRNKSSGNKIDEIEEIPLSEYSSIAPPPPKHGDETVISDYNDMVQLWRKYLVFVVYKRIQLRHEITMFQTMLASQDFKTRKLSIGSALNSVYQIHEVSDKEITDEASDVGTIESSYETITTSQSQVKDIKGIDDLVDVEVNEIADDGADTDVESEVIDDTESGSQMSTSQYSQPEVVHRFVPDANDEIFNRKYANRQSVLSDMLDYESSDDDDDLTITSLTSSSNSNSNYQSSYRSNSVSHSTLEIDKKYSIKQKKIPRSISSMSTTKKSPMKRSNGYPLDLYLAN